MNIGKNKNTQEQNAVDGAANPDQPLSDASLEKVTGGMSMPADDERPDADEYDCDKFDDPGE
jgi:hypothetical protein